MKLKDIANRFFRRKNKEIDEIVDEKNLEENMTESNFKQETTKQKVTKIKKKNYKYRITSPNNFKPITQIKHGTFILCDEIPDWAKNNSRIVIEKLD